MNFLTSEEGTTINGNSEIRKLENEWTDAGQFKFNPLECEKMLLHVKCGIGKNVFKTGCEISGEGWPHSELLSGTAY